MPGDASLHLVLNCISLLCQEGWSRIVCTLSPPCLHLVSTFLWVFRMAKAALLCLAPQVEEGE